MVIVIGGFMKVTNSYIFLKRKDEKLYTKENVIVVDSNSKMPKIFKRIFGIPTKDTLQDDIKNVEENLDNFYYVEKNIFNYKFNGNLIEIEYKFIRVNDTYYLDLTANNKKDEIIPFFEEINYKLVRSNEILKSYIPIQSYDIVSELYCNKMYPKLNNFERKIKKLLYLTYTSLFEEEYYKITTSKNLQNSVKERIRKPVNDNTPKEENRIKNFFYSLDYGNMTELLFCKNWTSVEENKINKFLEYNEKLNELSDKEIRDFIQDIKPYSDWERFFYKKGFCEEFESIINSINDIRNSVAHNKIITKDMYMDLNELLKKANKDIDKAIRTTEKKDFRNINEEHFKESMHKTVKSIREYTQIVFENIHNMLEKSVLPPLNEILKNNK